MFGTGARGSIFCERAVCPQNKYSEDDIIMMPEFLDDNIFVLLAGIVFQQTVGIAMGMNWPLV